MGLVCFHYRKLQNCYWGLLVFAFYSLPVCSWNPDSICMSLISSARRNFIHSSPEASRFIRGARVLARRKADGYYYLGHIAQQVKVVIYCSVSLFFLPLPWLASSIALVQSCSPVIQHSSLPVSYFHLFFLFFLFFLMMTGYLLEEFCKQKQPGNQSISLVVRQSN